MDEPLWPQLLLQAILIALNAFFASSEIALLSLNEGMLRLQAEEGDKTAGRLLAIVEAPTRFLSTIQIGITLAGFLGSAFAAENAHDRLELFAVKACAQHDFAESAFEDGKVKYAVPLGRSQRAGEENASADERDVGADSYFFLLKGRINSIR